MSEHKMDEELRRKLRTRLPFSRSATISFTPKAYTVKEESGEFEIPEEYQPIFQVRPMSKEQMKSLSTQSTQKKDLEAIGDKITRENIRGFERLYDAGTMEEIKFVPDMDGGMTQVQFESLPVFIRVDLFIYISGISGLQPYEKSGL